MKKALVLFGIVLSLVVTAASQDIVFRQSGLYLTPWIGIRNHIVPLGVSLEYGFARHWGIGLTAGYRWWGHEGEDHSAFLPEVEILYHSTNADPDIFGGLTAGYNFHSPAESTAYESGPSLAAVLGMRTCLSDKASIMARLQIHFIGSWTGLGGQFGMVFNLN